MTLAGVRWENTILLCIMDSSKPGLLFGIKKWCRTKLRNFRGGVPKLSINIEEIYSRAHTDFEEQNKAW
jgi:hypothetical protein